MDWFDVAAVTALALSLFNLLILIGILSDIRMVTRTVDRQLARRDENAARRGAGGPRPI